MNKRAEIQKVEVEKLLLAMDDECWKNRHHERSAFDPISLEVIWIIYNECKRLDREYYRVSVNQLSKMTSTTIDRIRERMKKLSRFGIIRVETRWRNDGSGLREPMMVFPNPVIMALLGVDKLTRKKLPVIQHYTQLGLSRLNHEDDVQGFKIDCAYGYPEPENGEPPLRTEDDLLNMIGRVDEEKARKEAENLLWRERDEIFVKGAADIWVFTQSQAGYGQSRPNWEGDLGSLSPAARKERMELTKTFQKYGGRVTALAWYVFSGGLPNLDERGNPIFSIVAPHRQFASIDKKPSQFAKHFNAILKDTAFLDLATKKWSYIKEPLEHYFESALSFPPRQETEYAMMGFEFGG